MKNIFRRNESNDILMTVWFVIIRIPTNIARDISVPPSEPDSWSRTRAAIVWIFMPIFFFFLKGELHLGLETDDEEYD